jgi:hypothetical protein
MTTLDAVNAMPRSSPVPDMSGSSRRVVLHDVSTRLGSTHERATREELARRIAKLNGWTFDPRAKPKTGERQYLLPNDTIVGIDAKLRLGVNSESDFLGGIVPAAFMAAKAVTHGLVDKTSFAPEGWSHQFSHAVERVVLRGYTCFTAEDARIAGSRLLQEAPFRFKPVKATGGRGQKLISSFSDMESVIRNVDAGELAMVGLVFEENLDRDVATYSVGRVQLADSAISYCGVQHLVPDNEGSSAYGGSDLVVVKGGFENLFAIDNLAPAMREAIGQVLIYDAAATRYFPDLLASRRNYDVIFGTSASGTRCSGVLEQSWRIGGATPAEIAAFEGFRDNPHAVQIQASAVEAYGAIECLPKDAVVYFQGLDENVGPITKYTCWKTDECGRTISSS